MGKYRFWRIMTTCENCGIRDRNLQEIINEKGVIEKRICTNCCKKLKINLEFISLDGKEKLQNWAWSMSKNIPFVVRGMHSSLTSYSDLAVIVRRQFIFLPEKVKNGRLILPLLNDKGVSTRELFMKLKGGERG